jgi:hypothetical protein
MSVLTLFNDDGNGEGMGVTPLVRGGAYALGKAAVDAFIGHAV